MTELVLPKNINLIPWPATPVRDRAGELTPAAELGRASHVGSGSLLTVDERAYFAACEHNFFVTENTVSQYSDVGDLPEVHGK